MAFAKFSVLQLQRRLCSIQPASRYIKIMYWVLAGSVTAWTVFSIFAIALQCGTSNPHVYEPAKCADGVLWYLITIMNLVTDAALAFSLSPIILKLSANQGTKLKIMILLGLRTLYVSRLGSLCLLPSN